MRTEFGGRIWGRPHPAVLHHRPNVEGVQLVPAGSKVGAPYGCSGASQARLRGAPALCLASGGFWGLCPVGNPGQTCLGMVGTPVQMTDRPLLSLNIRQLTFFVKGFFPLGGGTAKVLTFFFLD